jgi:dihydrodipicolinate synthase/N-acetylneuraminate lyase
MRIYALFVAGKLQEATTAQVKLAEMEQGFGKGGINGTKWIVAQLRGYPEGSWHCRRPFPKFDDEKKQGWIRGVVDPLDILEQGLGGQGV